MKLRPGCGCLVLVLGIMNALIVFLMIYGLIRGTMNRAPLPIVMLIVFASDVIVCLMVGLAAVRSGRRPATADAETTGQDDSEGEEPET